MEGICSSIEMWNAYWLRGAMSFLSVTGMVLAGTRFGCELRLVIANLSTVELSLQWTNYIKKFIGKNPSSWSSGKDKIIHHERVRWKTSPLRLHPGWSVLALVHFCQMYCHSVYSTNHTIKKQRVCWYSGWIHGMSRECQCNNGCSCLWHGYVLLRCEISFGEAATEVKIDQNRPFVMINEYNPKGGQGINRGWDEILLCWL